MRVNASYIKSTRGTSSVKWCRPSGPRSVSDCSGEKIVNSFAECRIVSGEVLAGTQTAGGSVGAGDKLQALVYDILPSTTAVFSYAIGSGKLSANEHLVLKQ